MFLSTMIAAMNILLAILARQSMEKVFLLQRTERRVSVQSEGVPHALWERAARNYFFSRLAWEERRCRRMGA